MFCSKCGTELDDAAIVCTGCGCPTANYRPNPQNRYGYQENFYDYPISPKSRLVTLLLAVFVGALGIHRFYLGKIGTGVLWLLTGGCLGIGSLVDIILIACGTMKDSYGYPVMDWQM